MHFFTALILCLTVPRPDTDHVRTSSPMTRAHACNSILTSWVCLDPRSRDPRSPDPRGAVGPRCGVLALGPLPRSPDPRSPDPRSRDPRSPDPRGAVGPRCGVLALGPLLLLFGVSEPSPTADYSWALSPHVPAQTCATKHVPNPRYSRRISKMLEEQEEFKLPAR